MNILHITDFHYSNDSSLQTKVIQSILNTLKEGKQSIDLVFFTGDLVQSGSKKENFQIASHALFDRLSQELHIKKENILFCAGNHDIDRNVIHTATQAYFDSNIKSDEELNNFYKKKGDSMYLDSIKPSNNFNSFLSEYHQEDNDNIIEDLFSIHYRSIGEKKYGIVCLNTAWISAIDKTKQREDKGNLLLPHALLEDVKRKLGPVDKKIVLLHHPLYFLKEYNFYGVENFIHNEFDLLFSGHVHKVSSIARYSGTNGIFEHVAKASLSSKEKLGYSLIELDEIEENKIRVNELRDAHKIKFPS